MRLIEAFAFWLASTPRREGTAKRYRAAIERLARWWDLQGTEDVTADKVREIKAEMLASGSSPEYVRTEIAALGAVLSELEEAGRFPAGLLAEVRKAAPKPERKGRRHRVRHLSVAEFKHLASAAERHEPFLELPLYFGAYLGPRTGELARLRAEDRLGGSMQVETLPEFGEFGACKTGPRTVPICAELAKILDERLPRFGWLFRARTSRTDRPFIAMDTLERALKRLRRRAGMDDDITFTVLRHTRASWWLQGGKDGKRGASLYKVADWLGHSFATCEHYYGSLVDGYDPECETRPADPVEASPSTEKGSA